MKMIDILFLMFIFPALGYGQQITSITTLQDILRETSGLIYLNQKLITHNDSGGEPALYEIDSITGDVVRTVVVSNATNVDWEDIAHDSTYIYIADFGNDSGSRTDLRIYRLPIPNYLMADNDAVTVDTIHFSYANQKDFTPYPFATNFDAEALISCNDSLYIFTKNWGNNWTDIYALPKTPGSYQIEKTDSINSQGLVTGATYNPGSNTVLLTGYAFVSPFIIEISDFSFPEFSKGSTKRYLIEIPSGYSVQIESIASVNQNQYYLTAEENIVGKSALYGLRFDSASNSGSIEEETGHIYPNPASNMVNIKHNHLSVVEIYDLQGTLQKASTSEIIYITDLREGVYIVIIKDTQGDRALYQKMIIK